MIMMRGMRSIHDDLLIVHDGGHDLAVRAVYGLCCSPDVA
jgi:hypothetical protein